MENYGLTIPQTDLGRTLGRSSPQAQEIAAFIAGASDRQLEPLVAMVRALADSRLTT